MPYLSSFFILFYKSTTRQKRISDQVSSYTLLNIGGYSNGYIRGRIARSLPPTGYLSG